LALVLLRRLVDTQSSAGATGGRCGIPLRYNAVRVTGRWPGRLVLRRGWAKAEARPWNSAVPDAHLRLVRGGAEFLEACADYLLDRGIEGVASPPLPEASAGIWLSAGYQPHLLLDLYSRDLSGSQPAPGHAVSSGSSRDWEDIRAIDHAAFPTFWRLEVDGLKEALAATPHSGILTARREQGTVGFAIVGVGSIAGYLQRVAVHPEHGRLGIGRSLVRAANRWAKRRGGRSMMLNTQPDNEAAARLYISEGFQKMPDQLTVLRTTRS
jgi:ribosomal protein S18 acetylase RimI-like enzyme